MDGHVKPSRTKPSSSRHHRRCRLVSLFSMAQEEEKEVKKMMVIETRDWSLVVAVVESSSRIRSITWRHFACHHSSSPSELCVCVWISFLVWRPDRRSVHPSRPSVRPFESFDFYLWATSSPRTPLPSFFSFFSFFLLVSRSSVTSLRKRKRKRKTTKRPAGSAFPTLETTPTNRLTHLHWWWWWPPSSSSSRTLLVSRNHLPFSRPRIEEEEEEEATTLGPLMVDFPTFLKTN